MIFLDTFFIFVNDVIIMRDELYIGCYWIFELNESTRIKSKARISEHSWSSSKGLVIYAIFKILISFFKQKLKQPISRSDTSVSDTYQTMTDRPKTESRSISNTHAAITFHGLRCRRTKKKEPSYRQTKSEKKKTNNCAFIRDNWGVFKRDSALRKMRNHFEPVVL